MCSHHFLQFTSLQKEIDDHKDEIKKLQAEALKLNNVIRSLEKDIQGLKKEIQERDDTIQDKVQQSFLFYLYTVYIYDIFWVYFMY